MKALTVYTLNGTLPEITPEALEEFLFYPLKKEDEVTSRLGFVPNAEGLLVSELGGNTCIRLATQQKKVNKYELGLLVAGKEKLFEEEFGRPFNKKEKDTVRMEQTERLLSTTYPSDDPKELDIIITKDGKVLVGDSPKKAEEALALLRKAIGSLPIIPLQTVTEPSARLSDMVIEEINNVITLGDKIVLETSEERKVSITNGSVLGGESLDLIQDGAFVTQLALEHDAVVKFMLKEDMSLASIKFEKSLTEEVEEGDAVGSFIITSTEMVKCVNEIIREFGGLVDHN